MPTEEEKKSNYRRSLLQVLLVCIGVTLMTLHSFNLVSRFLSKPVATELKFNAGYFEMPDVMICNPVPVVLTYYNKWMPQKIVDLRKEYYKERNKIIAQVGFPSSRNSSEEMLLTMVERGTMKDHPMYTQVWGRHIDEFLLDCSYNGIKCSPSDFKLFSHDNYMNCFIFQPNTTVDISSIEFVLFANNVWDIQRYTPKKHHDKTYTAWGSYRFDGAPVTDFSSGAVTFIYPKGNYPHKRYQVDIDAGVETLIKLQQTDISAKSTPSKPCHSQTNKVGYLNLQGTGTSFYNWTVDDCIQEQILNAFIKECSCLPTKQMSASVRRKAPFCFDAFTNESRNFSVPDYQKRYKCYIKFYQNMKKMASNTSCLLSCDSKIYEKQVTSKTWPIEENILTAIYKYVYPVHIAAKMKRIMYYGVSTLYWYGNELETMYKKDYSSYKYSYKNLKNVNITKKIEYSEYKNAESDLFKWFYKSVMKLKIEAASMRANVVHEQFAYPLAQLLSDIAGITGVYFGISVVTILEIWDFIAHKQDLVKTEIQRRKTRSKI